MSNTSYFPPDEDDDKPEIPKGPKVHELAGLGSARDWADQVVGEIVACKSGQLSWDKIDPGALISGPPGTGKTTLVRAIATSAQIRFIETGYGKLCAGSGNDIIAAIKKVFAQANANAPCIIFFDEIESFSSRSIDNHNTSYFTIIINTLLKCIERSNLKPGVIVIAATNHPDRVDEALKRPGRLDRHLEITLPRAQDLEAILAFHLKGDTYGIGDLASIAVLCVGKSGADIERLVRDARRLARQANRGVTRQDLIAIIEREAPKLSRQELERIAFHEAGHAVAVYRLRMSDDISVSLFAPKGAGGIVRAAVKTKVLTEFHVMCRLVALLSGRAAEETFCDEISTGSGGGSDSDIAQATDLAIRAYDDLALRSVWHGPTARSNGPASEEVLRQARRLLDEAYQMALELMDMEREFMRRLASALIAKRALAHDDLVALDPGKPQAPKVPPPLPPPSNDNIYSTRPFHPPRHDQQLQQYPPLPSRYGEHPPMPPHWLKALPPTHANDNAYDADDDAMSVPGKIRDSLARLWHRRGH